MEKQNKNKKNIGNDSKLYIDHWKLDYNILDLCFDQIYQL